MSAHDHFSGTATFGAAPSVQIFLVHSHRLVHIFSFYKSHLRPVSLRPDSLASWHPSFNNTPPSFWMYTPLLRLKIFISWRNNTSTSMGSLNTSQIINSTKLTLDHYNCNCPDKSSGSTLMINMLYVCINNYFSTRDLLISLTFI